MLMLLVTVVGYLLGSIPFGYLIGQAQGVDVRKYGSGATGGTNVLRTLGKGSAVATGLGDLIKGTAAAYIGYRLAGSPGYALAGFASIVGHSYPVWLRFKGGKSVATSAGALVLFHPAALVVGLVAGILAIIPTRWVSLGSLVAALGVAGTIWLSEAPAADKWLAAGAILVIYVRHWENMKRIAAGTENRLGHKAKPRTEH